MGISTKLYSSLFAFARPIRPILSGRCQPGDTWGRPARDGGGVFSDTGSAPQAPHLLPHYAHVHVRADPSVYLPLPSHEGCKSTVSVVVYLTSNCSSRYKCAFFSNMFWKIPTSFEWKIEWGRWINSRAFNGINPVPLNGSTQDPVL